MYCSKCGKFIESGVVCPECAIAEYEQTYFGTKSTEEPTISYEIPTTHYAEPNNRMFGFGLALTGQILADVSVIVSYFAILANVISSATGVIFAFISIIFIVLPLIMGIRSIQTFKERKRPCKRPIATLVLGITTLSTLPISVVYTLLAFVFVGAF